MQGAIQALIRHGVWLPLAVGLAAAPAAMAGEAALTADVPGGQHKSLRLRNLPKDTRLAMAIQSTGRITVTLVTEADFKRFPSPLEPVFIAPVEQAVSFTLTMPETGDYYLVLDNSKGADLQKVKMVIRATNAATPPRTAPAPGQPAPERREF